MIVWYPSDGLTEPVRWWRRSGRLTRNPRQMVYATWVSRLVTMLLSMASRVAYTLTLDPGPQVYATSMSMLVTMLLSVALFGLAPSLQLGLGIVTASISLVLYYGSPAALMNVRPVPAGGGSGAVSERLPK